MLATGVGSMPGTDDETYRQVVKTVFGVLEAPHGVPFVPELPNRGPGSSMIGRTLAVVSELGADLQPAGWRLTGTGATSGIDHRRAISQLAQDLDTVEELTQGWTGVLKTQLTGPWTLAATVEKPRGDKVLSDRGARRELAEALADGIGAHLRDLRRRVGGATRLVAQLDEPALGAVLNGQIPTASGYQRHRSVDRAELSTTLTMVSEAIAASGAECWVHSCARDVPWDLVTAPGLLMDLDQVSAAGLDTIAETLEAGRTIGFGIIPALDPADPGTWTDKAPAERIVRLLDMIGLDPAEHTDQIVISPVCGSAGATAGWARRTLELSRSVAANL